MIKFVGSYRPALEKLAIKAFLPCKKLTLNFEVRWLCSTVLTLNNFRITYPVIILFLQKCSRNRSKSLEESTQNRATELLVKMCDPFHIRSVNALLDILNVVNAELVLPFQSNRLTVRFQFEVTVQPKKFLLMSNSIVRFSVFQCCSSCQTISNI